MLELPHTLVGAAIGLKINQPLISLPLALGSHFLLDFIPHWNPSLYTETKKTGKPSKKSTQLVILDAGLSLVSGFGLASLVWPDFKRWIIVLLACLLSVLPDVIEAPYFFFKFRHPLLVKLIQFQHDHQGRAKKVPGLLIQAVTIIITLLFVFA